MSIYVDPDKIEGLGEKLGRFSLDVEEMDENLRRMILSYLDEEYRGKQGDGSIASHESIITVKEYSPQIMEILIF